MTKGVWFRNKELHPLMWHRCYFRITTTTKSVAKINVKIEQMKKQDPVSSCHLCSTYWYHWLMEILISYFTNASKAFQLFFCKRNNYKSNN